MVGTYNIKISCYQGGIIHYALNDTIQIYKDNEKELQFAIPEPVIEKEEKEIVWVKKQEGQKNYIIDGTKESPVTNTDKE